MSDIKEFIPNYERACAIWPDASNLRQCVDAVHRSADGLKHGLIEHVKSCVECLCITILNDRGDPVPALPSGVELLRLALDSLGLQNTRGHSRIDNVVSGFNKIAEGIVALRNEHGVVGHGKDGFLETIASDHLRSFLFVGDAICGLLLAAYQNLEPNLSYTREPYERFQRQSKLLDRSVVVKAEVETTDDSTPILVVEVSAGPGQVPTLLRIEPSKLLFSIERAAYVDLLAQSQQFEDDEVISNAEEEDAATETSEFAAPTLEVETPRIILPSRQGYLGTLEPIRSDIAAHIAPLNLSDNAKGRLLEILLAEAENGMGPDWRVRESLKASMRVDFAAAMRQEGVPVPRAKQEAADLQRWLAESVAVQKLEAQGEAKLD